MKLSFSILPVLASTPVKPPLMTFEGRVNGKTIPLTGYDHSLRTHIVQDRISDGISLQFQLIFWKEESEPHFHRYLNNYRNIFCFAEGIPPLKVYLNKDGKVINPEIDLHLCHKKTDPQYDYVMASKDLDPKMECEKVELFVKPLENEARKMSPNSRECEIWRFPDGISMFALKAISPDSV